MSIEEKIAQFVENLMQRGYHFTTYPDENKSKDFGGAAFTTTIEKDGKTWEFQTYAGYYVAHQSVTDAFRWIYEEMRTGDVIDKDSYEEWVKEDAFHEKELGEGLARLYFQEAQTRTRTLLDALGETLFYELYYIDQG